MPDQDQHKRIRKTFGVDSDLTIGASKRSNGFVAFQS